MNADEIRRIHAQNLDSFNAAMLQEIAAQLAELNQVLRVTVAIETGSGVPPLPPTKGEPS